MSDERRWIACRSQGVSLMEALVALLLGLFLITAGLTGVARVRIHHERLVERTEALAAVRMAGTVLRAELRAGDPTQDWRLQDDSLSLRAFRGTGLVCDSRSESNVLVVSYVGYRRPDPDKDSVLLVYPGGGREVEGLGGFSLLADSVCGGAPLRNGLELRLADPVPRGAVVARIFERGAYVLSDGALRYRRGSGGRQPLTPELWSDRTGWLVVDGRVEAELVPNVIDSPPAMSTLGSTSEVWRIPVAAPRP